MSESLGTYLAAKQTLILSIDGQVVPKARPRFKSGQGGFLPQRYRDWKEGAILQLRSQVAMVEGFSPMSKVHLAVMIQGASRGDLDNLAGAIMDALVQAGILKDDSVSCVRSLSIQHQPSKKPYSTITISHRG
jgi:Holliday junction resolvase RusA-like endonuclease